MKLAETADRSPRHPRHRLQLHSRPRTDCEAVRPCSRTDDSTHAHRVQRRCFFKRLIRCAMWLRQSSTIGSWTSPTSHRVSAATIDNRPFLITGTWCSKDSNSPDRQWRHVRLGLMLVAENTRIFRLAHALKPIVIARRIGGSLHRRRGFGQRSIALVPDIGVLFHRGDSPGEGGSNVHWLSRRWIQEVLDRLRDGGLVVTDGSLAHARALRRFHNQEVSSEGAFEQAASFSKWGRRWHCVGRASRR
jgi:hypothetical protein